MSLVSKTIAIPVSSTTAKTSYSGAIRSSDTGAYILEITWIDVDAITGACTLHFTMADGTSADRDASDGVVISGKKVTYTLEPALYAAKGLKCYVQFINSNLYTPLMIEFGGIEVVPGGTAVASAEPYPTWAAAMRSVGAYSALTAYAVGNHVTYSGGYYRCIVATTAGTIPTDTDYWILVASKGDTGATGATGATGPANTLTAGTVTTLAAGEDATSEITGTAPNQTLNLGIPQGTQGDPGAAGPNSVTTSTLTNMTGLIAGGGTNIQAPTAAQVGVLPMPDAGNLFPGLTTLTGQMQSAGSQLAQIENDMTELQNTGVDTTARDRLEQTVAASKNLFNKVTSISGKYVASWTGALLDNATYTASDYISVTGGQTYVMTVSSQYAFYDANKTYISGATSDTMVAPANALYLRVSMLSVNVDNTQVENSAAKTYYQPYGEKIKHAAISELVNNIKSYGAVLDGVTDDAAALTRAIATGRPVYIPSGTCLCSGITLPSNVKLYGDGIGVSILKLVDDATKPLIDMSGTSLNVKSNITISDLTLMHNKTFTGSGNNVGTLIYGLYTSRILLSRVEFKTFNYNGIYASYVDANTTLAQGWLIQQCIFRDGGAAAVGIFFDSETEYSIASGCIFHTLNYGVVLTNAANNSVLDSVFLNCKGILINKTSEAMNSGKTIISGCAINHSTGIGIEINSTAAAANITRGDHICNNEIILSAAECIKLYGAQGVLVSNNRLLSSVASSIVLSDSSIVGDYNLISNNIALGQTLLSNTSTGIHNVIGNNIG